MDGEKEEESEERQIRDDTERLGGKRDGKRRGRQEEIEADR